MTVSISGCVLSSLLFKLKNVTADGEGFLLGEVRTHRVENITDSQSSGTREEKRISVNSYICFNGKHSFYDRSGALNITRIEQELGDNASRVIGWFSYRRNSSHRVSLRERAVHRRLMEYFEAMSNKDFLFALFTDLLEETTCIVTTDYSFYHWVASSPQNMKVEIINLRASAAVPYQLLPAAQIPSSLTHYNSLLEQQRAQFVDKDGNMVQVKAVENLYRAMLQRLEPLSKELSVSSEEAQKLGEEVSRLQEQVDELRKEQAMLFEKEGLVTPIGEHHEPEDNDQLLIDLESPSDDLSPQPMSATTSDEQVSHDLLGGDLMESTDPLETRGEILQPEVLTDKQSQDLF